jgi:hypothetical protein
MEIDFSEISDFRIFKEGTVFAGSTFSRKGSGRR